MRSGDLIATKVNSFPLLQHYGIITITGAGVFVMHNTPQRGTVTDPLETFLQTRTITSIKRTWLNQLTETELQTRFNACKGDFNLLNYNCEHFIDCMLGDEPNSAQLNYVVITVLILFGLLVFQLNNYESK